MRCFWGKFLKKWSHRFVSTLIPQNWSHSMIPGISPLWNHHLLLSGWYPKCWPRFSLAQGTQVVVTLGLSMVDWRCKAEFHDLKMENKSSIYHISNQILKRGESKIGQKSILWKVFLGGGKVPPLRVEIRSQGFDGHRSCLVNGLFKYQNA